MIVLLFSLLSIIGFVRAAGPAKAELPDAQKKGMTAMLRTA